MTGFVISAGIAGGFLVAACALYALIMYVLPALRVGVRAVCRWIADEVRWHRPLDVRLTSAPEVDESEIDERYYNVETR